MTRARLAGALLAGATLLGAASTPHAQGVVWEQVVNGLVPGSIYPGSTDNLPYTTANAVAVDAAGDVFVAGNVIGFSDAACRIVKHSAATGAVLWMQSFQSGYPQKPWCSIAVDASGDVFLGSTRANEFVAVKYAGSTGQAIWEAATTGSPVPVPGNFTLAELGSIVVDAGGDVILTGSRGAVGASVQHLRTVKFAGGNGTLRWQDIDTSAMGRGNVVMVDGAGNAVVVASFVDAFVTIKYASNGARAWRQSLARVLPGGYPRQVAALDSSGNVVASTDTVRKFAAADGAVLWSKPFGSGTDQVRGIVMDGAGNALVSGSAEFSFIAGRRYKAAKLAAVDGMLLWERDFARPGYFNHDAYGSAVDAGGNLLVTGLSGNFNGTDMDGVTVKFAANDGTVLWDRTINAASRDDAMVAVTVDGAGNIVAAGFSVFPNPSPHRDLQVVKYNAAGTELWRIGPSNLLVPSASWTQGLAVDPAGNVLVAGYYWGPNVMQVFDDNEDVVVAKLSSATGAPMIGFAYSGPWPDAPHGVGADANGDIIFSGTATQDGNGNAVVRTAKHSGTTGQLLWQVNGAAPGHRWGYSSGFAVDGGGNVIATARDFTQKYAGPNGAVLWTSAIGGGRVVMTTGGDAVVYGDGRVSRLSGANGAVVWTMTSSPGESFRTFAVDGGGNVFIGVASRIVKVSSGGAVLFEREIPVEPGYGPSGAGRIVADAAGDIVLIHGFSNYPTVPTSSGSVILKMSGVNGDVLWRRSRPVANSFSSPDLVALDAAGNPFVVGPEDGKLRMSRYAGATGAPLYDGTYATVDTRPAIPYYLAISGDAAYIAGELDSMNTDSIFVIKLDFEADVVPAPFSFAAHVFVDMMTMQVSAAVVPTGYNRPVPVTVAGGEFSIGCNGTFQATPGTIVPGQAICVRHRSAGATLRSLTTTLTIGGVVGEFTSTTAQVDDLFTNPRTFAQQQYRDFLGREADAAGLDVWTRQTADGLMTREELIEAFFDSTEFQAGLPQVTRLYLAFFDRIPDYPGLLFHAGRYRVGVPLDEIAQDFAASEEFLVTYGALSNGEYVDRVYQNVLGRAADPVGRTNALAQLEGGAMTRGQLMVAFSESPEHVSLTASDVFVTAIYVGMLRRAPDPAGLQTWVNAFGAGLPRLQMLGAFLASEEYSNRFRP